jgi:L-iditol 2-dehydrogenase
MAENLGMAGQMLAAVYDGTPHIRLIEQEIPKLGPREALLKVATCGICGTDLRILGAGHRGIPAGTKRVLGHELSGEIVEVGAELGWPRPGMRVAVAPNMGCGHCDRCIRGETQLCADYLSFGVGLDGGFAGYMRIPHEGIAQGNVIEIPDRVGFEAAALNEPLSCAYRGMMACRPEPGESVLIVGAGPIGLMHLLLAKAIGAGLVIVSSTSTGRGQQAKRFGADAVIEPGAQDLAKAVNELTLGRGVDIAIVAAPSSEAQAQCVEVLAHHGRVNFFGGLPKGNEGTKIDANLVHYRELVLTGTTGQTVHDYRTAMGLIASGKVDVGPLASEIFPLRDIQEAFKMARSKSNLRTMVHPWQ